MRRTTLIFGIICLALALVACDASLEGAGDLARRLGDSVALPGEGAPPAPTITRAPSPEPTVDISACQPSLAYVDDVTIPDGMPISGGETFTKTWSVINAGSCPWGPGFFLRFVDGEPMGLSQAVPLPAAEPGQTVTVSVPMRAPSTPGSYRTDWRLSVADGTYGTTIYAVIEATEPIATPTPEASPTPTTSPTPIVAAASTEVVSTEAQPSAAVTAATPQADEGIRAVIAYDEKGLWITNLNGFDWHNVYVEVNPAILRRGYVAALDLLAAGERAFWAPNDLRRPDGTAWPAEEAPFAVFLLADEGDFFAEPN
ncbi:MAG: NBR1-Ig-like domain-containing protein [Anaerolineae bacterium]